jgi:hypothetical protein
MKQAARATSAKALTAMMARLFNEKERAKGLALKLRPSDVETAPERRRNRAIRQERHHLGTADRALPAHARRHGF